MTELYVRSDATLTDVRFKDRIIELIAVPWEQEGDVIVRGEVWREVFQRGAFNGLSSEGVERPASRREPVQMIRVNREHVKGLTVGKAVFFDTHHADGLFTRIQIAETDLGNETLALARDDMISASIGYRIAKPSDVSINRTGMIRRVKRAFLDHIGMVESPTFSGAEVLAVHKESQVPMAANGKPLEMPRLYDALNDPVFKWAESRGAPKE